MSHSTEQAARIAAWETRAPANTETIMEAALCAWEHVLELKAPEELTRDEYMGLTSEVIFRLNTIKQARLDAGATALRWYCMHAAPMLEGAYTYMQAYRPDAFCDAYDWIFIPAMFDTILDWSDFPKDVFDCAPQLRNDWRQLVEAWIDAEAPERVEVAS